MLCHRFPEAGRVQKAIWTVAALGFFAILVTAAPDTRRSMRMRAM
jgi:hypothetical protein